MDFYSNPAVILLAVIFILVMITVGLVVYVLQSLFLSKIFKRTGVEKSWKAWIPVYSQWVLMENVGVKGWLILPALLTVSLPDNNATVTSAEILFGLLGLAGTVVTLIASYVAAKRYAIAFGKEKDATPLSILYILFTIIWFGFFAYTKSEFNRQLLPQQSGKWYDSATKTAE